MNSPVQQSQTLEKWAQLIVDLSSLDEGKLPMLEVYWNFVRDPKHLPTKEAIAALQADAHFRRAVENFAALDDDQIAGAMELLRQRSLASPHTKGWWLEGSLKLPQSTLGLCLHLTELGGSPLELSRVTEILAANGLQISSQSWLFSQMKKNGWVNVLKPAAGNQSALFELTKEGTGEAKRLKANCDHSN